MAALVSVILICCLTFNPTNAANQNSVKSVKDNSAKSVSRLYGYNPVGLYASASPHGAYSLYAPTYVSGLQPASSQIVPVKEENFIVHKSNGFLKDSYGNRFIGTPQSVAYKTILPQQFVQLQDLPAHLSQPLAAASPSYQLKQQSPHYYFASPHVTALRTIPSVTHFMRPQSFIYGEKVKNLASSALHNTRNNNYAGTVQQLKSQVPKISTPQQQSTSNKAVYTNSQNVGHNSDSSKYNHQLRENSPPKYQTPKSSSPIRKQVNSNKSPVAHSITTTVNGKKTLINFETKPTLPLLDISLLEPLTFTNPVVPQLQHFLPRIPTATYHKLPDFGVEAKKHDNEFIITNTRSYESGDVRDSSDEDTSENGEKYPEVSNDSHSHQEDKDEHSTPTPKIKKHEEPNAQSPNYKETYKEKVLSYNKQTQNEPVSYSYSKNSQQKPVYYVYSKNTEKKPTHYSNTYSSTKPIHTKEIDYENEDRAPKQLVYEFKSETPHSLIQEPILSNVLPQATLSQSDSTESDESGESGEEKSMQSPHSRSNNQYSSNINKLPDKPEHRQEIRKNPEQKEQFAPIQYLKPQSIRPPIRVYVQQVTTPEYEENIQFWPLDNSHAAVKVDPSQHIKQKSAPPQEASNKHNLPFHSNDGYHRKDPGPHFHGTAKRVIIKDESPDEKHLHQEQMMKEETNHEENSEEDFEKSYKNAAYGFPAFEKISDEEEREFDPDSYVPQYHTEYNIQDNPFEQYQSENDEYPKSMRASYKDTNDKTKDNYYLDYSINKPESLVDQYQNKIDYYKMFRNHKKDNYSPFNDNGQKEKKSKYVSAPSYGFESGHQQKPKKFEEYKTVEPQFYEYNYEKEAPRDNSAHPTPANLRSKSKTQFVEPQFQYGFEPLPLPSLLDGELAAVASNDSHKSENPGTKKSYKENFYLKKTNTSSGKPTS